MIFPRVLSLLAATTATATAAAVVPATPFTSSSSASAGLRSRAATPSTCNGHSELCDRSYGNVTFIGAHDSYANGTTLADNQNIGVQQQLDDGVRLLQVQMHNQNGDVHLCHTSCSLLDGGLLSDYLAKVKTWLDQNTQDVVTLLLVNSDTLSPTTIASSFSTAGLNSGGYLYTPSSATTAKSDWPTLSNMISNDGRLVVFMDYNADFGSVPWIIDEFSNVVEDAYDVTSADWSCAANRTSGSPQTTLQLHNHFLDTFQSVFGINTFLPDKASITTTNDQASIMQGVNNCVSLYGSAPNFILLDFIDSNGNTPFNVAASLNGVSAPTTTIASAGATGTSSSTASGGQAQATSTSLASGAASRRREGAGLVAGAVVTIIAALVASIAHIAL